MQNPIHTAHICVDDLAPHLSRQTEYVCTNLYKLHACSHLVKHSIGDTSHDPVFDYQAPLNPYHVHCLNEGAKLQAQAYRLYMTEDPRYRVTIQSLFRILHKLVVAKQSKLVGKLQEVVFILKACQYLRQIRITGWQIAPSGPSEASTQALGGAKALKADEALTQENEHLKKLLGEKALELDLLKSGRASEYGAGRHDV